MSKLDELFIKYGTDKSSQFHGYQKVYEDILNPYIGNEFNLLILGIGGYSTNRGGGDLLAFKEYLPEANIHGIDVYDKSFLNQDRIYTHIGSQDDKPFLEGIIHYCGSVDIIIEDASHNNQMCIESFKILFPLLNSGGTYIVEDIETSWYGSEEYKGCWDYEDYEANTTINFFRKLLNDINRQYIAHYKSDFIWASEIEYITFHKNIIVIKKK